MLNNIDMLMKRRLLTNLESLKEVLEYFEDKQGIGDTQLEYENKQLKEENKLLKEQIERWKVSF